MRQQPPYQELSRSIKGKTALITGAASGMGRATAHLFAREGANVAVTDLKQENVDIVVEAIAEDLEIKLQLFGDLDRICKPGAILATTTSSPFSLAEPVRSSRPIPTPPAPTTSRT